MPYAEEARNYLNINEKVIKVDSKVILIISDGLLFNWKQSL